LTAKPKGKDSKETGELMASAERASGFLKALANEKRLLLLCLLASGDKGVSELRAALDMQQAAVSQQLARLRADDLVTFKRNGKSVRYSLASNEARRIIGLLYELYCEPKTKTKNGPTSPHP
jgi:DNA-binding transcriptional ArsR family regulator